MKYLKSCFCILMMCLPFYASAQNMQTNIPEQFEVYIGGFLGSSYKVTLEDDGRLAYRHALPGVRFQDVSPVYIQPTQEQWQTFCLALDANNIWNWENDYGTECCDGTGWYINLKTEEKTLSSRGHNRFPPQGFDTLLKAVSNLSGQTFQ